MANFMKAIGEDMLGTAEGRFRIDHPGFVGSEAGYHAVESIAMAKNPLTCQRRVGSLSNHQYLRQPDPFLGSHHAQQLPSETLRPPFVFSSFSVLALYFTIPYLSPGEPMTPLSPSAIRHSILAVTTRANA